MGVRRVSTDEALANMQIFAAVIAYSTATTATIANHCNSRNCLPMLGTQLLTQSLRRAQAGTRSAREVTPLAHAEAQLLQ
jgi:hypothetical protein